MQTLSQSTKLSSTQFKRNGRTQHSKSSPSKNRWTTLYSQTVSLCQMPSKKTSKRSKRSRSHPSHLMLAKNWVNWSGSWNRCSSICSCGPSVKNTGWLWTLSLTVACLKTSLTSTLVTFWTIEVSSDVSCGHHTVSRKPLLTLWLETARLYSRS